MFNPNVCTAKENQDKQECKDLIGEGEFRLTLPLFDNSEQRINPKLHQEFIGKVNNHFGGSTSWRVGGCVINEKKDLQCEGNVTITAIRDFQNPYDNRDHLNYNERKKVLQDDYEELKKIAREAGQIFGQESIITAFDNIKDASFLLGKRKQKLAKNLVLEETEPFRDIF